MGDGQQANEDIEIGLLDEWENVLAVNDDVLVGDTSSGIGVDLPVGIYYMAVRDSLIPTGFPPPRSMGQKTKSAAFQDVNRP